ncbi:MAG: phosphatase [Planctomyces sp.]|nr:phosphatase [Planctomyces sp.]
MAQRIRIDESLTIGPQPSREQIKDLARSGFKTVVNFRTTGEEGEPHSPHEERGVVESEGMQYLHVPVSMSSMNAEVVDRFRERIESLPEPIYAHCKSGTRAGAMFMMHLAAEKGLTGRRTLEQAELLGFKCDKQELKDFVKHYVDDHSNARR